MTTHIPSAVEIERKQQLSDRASRQRTNMQRAVKDVREKITSTSGLVRAFEMELARIFAKNHTSALIALMPFTAIVAIATLSWTTPVRAVGWLLMGEIALVVQFMICRRFLARTIDDDSLGKWVARFIISEIVLIMTWAMLPQVVGLPESEALRLFLLFSTLLFAAVCTVLSHSLPSAVYGSIFPLVAMIVIIALDRSPAEKWMIAGLSFAALMLFVVLARSLYQNTLQALAARAEKDELFAEVEQTNMRLQEATKRSEDANAAKSKFLATMSHELRTPLNAILGFSEVMRGEMFGPIGNEQYKSYIEDIHASGQHLLGLINEVLDLSRIEAGKHELQEEAIDLVSTVEACVSMLDIRAKGRGLIVRPIFTNNMARLWADERAVRQVVLNLLSNAIKFTPQGAEVVVKVGWTSAGGQYLSVRDNGPGIPEDEIETVMSTFGRGSMALKNADQGSGLGLPIVKSLVELHGGAFRLSSRVREGTEALAIFPASRVMQNLSPVAQVPTRSRAA